MKLVHFNKHFAENCMLNIKFNPKMDIIRTFFSQIRALFFFKKRAEEASPLLFPLVACLIM